MNQSKFQFSNPNLIKFNFQINPDFEYNNEKIIQFDLKTNTSVEKDSMKRIATVQLDIEIGENNPNYPFWIHVSEMAVFKWDEDTKNVEKLLNQNAPALLLSYMRPVIAAVTSASKYPAYHLPYIDFTQGNKNP